MFKYLIYIAILASLASCKQDYVEEPKQLPTVPQARVEQLVPTQDPLPIFASGRIEVLENARLSFKTGGIVREVLVEDGQTVQKGQVLARLDLAEINAQVKQAQAQVTKLQRDLSRFERLYADSATTLQNVQDLQTALDVAQANLAIATFNQTYSQIVAPASGTVLAKMVEENELVNPGQPIIMLSEQAAGMSLNVGLSDRDIVRVNLGDTAKIALDAYPGEEAIALVTEIAANAHPRVGTYRVELTLQPFPHPVKNGFFAKAHILPTNQVPYYRIPMRALVGGNQREAAIYTALDNKAVRTTIRPLYFGDDYIAVRVRDLSNSSIITEGAAYLQSDQPFETLNN